MRYSMVRALEHFEWPFDSFTGQDFLQWFKNYPTSNGLRRKIYPANASATAAHLTKIAKHTQKIEIVDIHDYPKKHGVRFRKVIDSGEEKTSGN